jgi:uncharacterized integral membrane protein (TIGR00698 family)
METAVPVPRRTAGHWLLPLGALVCLWPAVSPGMGLVLGLALALLAGNPYLATTRTWTHRLLAIAIIGLGAGMDLRVVARVGAHGFVYTAVGISFALGLGLLLARRLGVTRNIGLLISVGTAICGGSAIAALVPVLGPDDNEVSVALATVFLLNAVALVLFPPLGHALHLSDVAFGLWSALAIHDTSSVVGAAVAYGGKAVEIATTVKLTRALWIVPVTLFIARLTRRTRPPGAPRPKRPWFIAGFVAAAALVTFVPAISPVGHLLSLAAKQLLVVTLFLIGAGLTRAALKTVGARPFAHGLSLWLLVGSATLGAVLAGWIR